MISLTTTTISAIIMLSCISMELWSLQSSFPYSTTFAHHNILHMPLQSSLQRFLPAALRVPWPNPTQDCLSSIHCAPHVSAGQISSSAWSSKILFGTKDQTQNITSSQKCLVTHLAESYLYVHHGNQSPCMSFDNSHALLLTRSSLLV